MAVAPAGDAGVLHRLHHLADVAHPHGGAVVGGDDHRPILLGVAELVVDVDGLGQLRAVEAALGQVDIGLGEGGTHVFQAEAVTGEAGGIDADADGRPLSALDQHSADTADLA